MKTILSTHIHVHARTPHTRQTISGGISREGGGSVKGALGIQFSSGGRTEGETRDPRAIGRLHLAAKGAAQGSQEKTQSELTISVTLFQPHPQAPAQLSHPLLGGEA